MSTPLDGGPDYPPHGLSDDSRSSMSLRDYFAGQALAGIMSNCDPSNITPETVAKSAYVTADAMLAARPPNNGPGGTEGEI